MKKLTKGLLYKPDNSPLLRDTFGVPPFTVFDTRRDYWMKHKRKWIRMGIVGEAGRAGYNEHGVLPDKLVDTKTKDGKTRLKGYSAKEHEVTARSYERLNKFITKKNKNTNKSSHKELPTTSVFDPVLCELVYRWFCIPHGRILDPFAGGVSRGIIAEQLEFKYTGIEVRKEQIDLNEIQAKKLKLKPKWILGDSKNIDKLIDKKRKFDLIFTCPPYYNLEVYSESNEDGSTKQTYEDFIIWYRKLFGKTVKYLHDNRFVIVVVGEIRNMKTGVYYNFVGDTIKCFMDLGLHYFNEALLLTALGSAPLRAKNQFKSGRKLCKTHQTVLMFWKGDPKEIKKQFSKLSCSFGRVQ